MGDVIRLKLLPPLPTCGAKPNLPSFLSFPACGLPQHSDDLDHVSYADGVTITWNSLRIAQFRALLNIRERP